MGILMEKKVYKFVTLLEAPAGQQEFYANNFMLFNTKGIYFFESNRKSEANFLIILEVVTTIKNRCKYFCEELNYIHNGSYFIEVRRDFVKEVSVEEIESSGIIRDLVAMRLSGQLL